MVRFPSLGEEYHSYVYEMKRSYQNDDASVNTIDEF